jgi:hypothetical protein
LNGYSTNTKIIAMATSTPTKQTAAVIINAGPNGSVDIRNDAMVGKPGKNEVLVKLTHSGIW